MANRIQEPRIPNPPERIEDLARWGNDLKRELERWAADITQFGADNQLTGRVEDQFIVDGFTIRPNSPLIGLTCDGNVTSDATIAIKAGLNGQTIQLHNQSDFTITFKNGALIRCLFNTDLVLAAGDVVQFHWDRNQAKWFQIGVSQVGPS